MASKTGCTSVGELLMTRRISAGRRLLLQRLREVAVARLQLLEQPHVLDGDDRLVGEGLEQRDLLVREGLPGSRDVRLIAPIAIASRSSIGTASMLR